MQTFDVVILGGGMVGLSLANQILDQLKTANILVIDKERSLGRHSSGRNSGVMHVQVYTTNLVVRKPNLYEWSSQTKRVGT